MHKLFFSGFDQWEESGIRELLIEGLIKSDFRKEFEFYIGKCKKGKNKVGKYRYTLITKRRGGVIQVYLDIEDFDYNFEKILYKVFAKIAKELFGDITFWRARYVE